MLPYSRVFEFKLTDQPGVLKGNIGMEITDPNILNIVYLRKPLLVTFHVIQVGKGRPRYTLMSPEAIQAAKGMADSTES